ncbi:MAG TPA: tRNA (adenosine(37)-N6)-dimethylallyltransferase MiaA [Rhizomicrobium sp.]|nr:tRNA (adenosine(37)-N6)-dimethylallyltransferase MiaA [Rhizomicrobium sp.]
MTHDIYFGHHPMTVDAVLIAGPTASGKSALALALAEKLGGVVINADSMQVYAEAPVLTAAPDAAARARVPHFLYGHVSARDGYSTGRYAIDAARALQEARAMKRIPVFTGGTGLYFTALTEGLSDMPAIPAAVRAATRALLAQIGPQALHARLAERDPAGAALLRPTDPQRIARAWEVLQATGTPLPEWHKRKGRPVLAGLRLAKFVLDMPRDVLRLRIAQRFEAMVERGGLQEAQALMDLDPALPAARLLGLRPLQALAAGDLSRGAALARAITDTGRFAKRQVTWFRHHMSDYGRIDASVSNFITKTIDEYV